MKRYPIEQITNIINDYFDNPIFPFFSHDIERMVKNSGGKVFAGKVAWTSIEKAVKRNWNGNAKAKAREKILDTLWYRLH